MTEPMLSLGRRRDDDEPVELPMRALLRHAMALGSSGSGKTVLCKVLVEEVVRHGLPVLCIDPQGDLCSLALDPTDPQALREHGIDPGRAEAFAERADVVVFTPASTTGIGLSADPVDLGLEGMREAERTHAITRTAAILTGLLGYDPESDDGTGLTAVLDRSVQELVAQGRAGGGLAALGEYLHALPPRVEEEFDRYLDRRKVGTARQRLARLDVGARRMLFHQGAPIDIDMLLGRGAHAVPGRTRVAVIYLNTLHGQEDKDFFVATLVDRLYAWMLRNPSAQPQAMFYIDEVAPFVPPVRKPAAKPGLQLLFKQARKYGVCCLMATQNPGDVDYKSMAQFGTWALGRLTTRQDLKKVEPTLKSLVPTSCDRVVGALPSLGPGQFVLISPDHHATPQALGVRWLLTPHETLDEERIEALADERWRERFAPLLRGVGEGPAVSKGEAAQSEAEAQTEAQTEAQSTDEGSARAVESSGGEGEAVEVESSEGSAGGSAEGSAEEQGELEEPEDLDDRIDPPPSGWNSDDPPRSSGGTLLGTPVPPPPRGRSRERRPAPMPVRTGMTQVAPTPVRTGQTQVQPAVALAAAAPMPVQPDTSTAMESRGEPPVGGSVDLSGADAPALEEPPPFDPLEERRQALSRFDRILAQKKSMTVSDFATRAGIGQTKARGLIASMIELKMASMYLEGRKKMYWASSTGGRPDLGMPRRVVAVRPIIDAPTARARGHEHLRSKLLGVFGRDETLARVEPMHRLVYRLDFEEKVQRPLFRRVLGDRHDHRLGSVYLHASTLDVLVYTADKGLRFVSAVGEHASEVEDLDGVVTFEEVGPGHLGLVDEDWRTKKPVAQVKARFSELFAAVPGKVAAVFVPLWRLVVRVGTGEGFRVVTIDGIGGRPVQWP
ncbi:MAG: helicase HerA-like domain-containing protein [Myxococcota bacterium]